MDNYLNNTLKSKLKGLAYYQILGGVTGILMTFWLLMQTGQITGITLFFLIVALGLYSFSLYCGQRLLRGDSQTALKLTSINQFIQVFNFGAAGYAFRYVAGLLFAIGADLTDGFKFTSNFSISAFQFDWNLPQGTFDVGINLIAIFLVYYADKLTKEVKGSRELHDASVAMTAEIRN